MKDWGNWTKEKVLEVIAKAKIKGDKSISLDFEHTTWENHKQMFDIICSYGWDAEMKIESILIKNLQIKPGRI